MWVCANEMANVIQLMLIEMDNSPSSLFVWKSVRKRVIVQRNNFSLRYFVFSHNETISLFIHV